MMLAHPTSIAARQWFGATRHAGVQAEARPPWGLRAAFVFALISITLLERFGINFGSYSLDASFIALYVLLAALLLAGRAALDVTSALLYAAAVGVAIVSLLVNTNIADVDRSSLTSFVLLVVLYFPFVFAIKRSDAAPALWLWFMRAFSYVALFCALAGILQFYAQFFIHKPWLFDFTPFIPEAVRGPAGYNTTISVGSLYKSNGFFFREPSGFSFLMGLALVAEFLLFKRMLRMVLFGLALLLTYSGTGLLALFIGLLFPLGRRTIVQLAVVLGVGLLVVLLFGDTLNLSFTLRRVTEFDAPGSSGYARYIAPLRVVADTIGSDVWTPLLGHGPGTIQRTAQRFEFFDPTWAKLLFEYGVFGVAAFGALIVYTMNRYRSPVQIRAMLFFAWLVMGGHLLSPDNLILLFAMVCAWPVMAVPGGEKTIEPEVAR